MKKLINLFTKNSNEYDVFDIYAIEIIHSEAYCKSIVAFIQKYNIPKEKVKYILQVKPIY